MASKLVIKGLYRHYKGNTYMIESLARLESTGDEMVIYRALTETRQYTRPVSEFVEIIDEKRNTPRFTLLSERNIFFNTSKDNFN